MKSRSLYPALLLAAGMLLSMVFAVYARDIRVLLAPLGLALSVLAADTLDSYLRGGRARPSYGAMILAASFLLAGLLVGWQDPVMLKDMMPVLGASAAITLARRTRRKDCLPQS